MKAKEYDQRYAYVTCSKCGQKYQRIDYGCALHQLTCGYPVPPQVEPHPTHTLTTRQWLDFDASNGIISKEQARRERANIARRERDQVCRDMGLKRVRGALGGIYWE